MWITTNCGKFLKRLEYQTTLPASWETCTKVKKTIVKTGHGTMEWFKIGKGVCQGCVLSPCLFNLYAEYIMWNARLKESQAGIKIAGKNINNLRYADDTTLMAEKEEELKSLLIKVKEESEKAGFKLYMWPSLDGQYRSQIDYILCSQRWRSSIQSAKTRLGIDCGSDHEFLIAKFRLKLKKVGKTRRRQWHPTPVFLPGESQGRGSLVGCSLWGRTETDMTEAT